MRSALAAKTALGGRAISIAAASLGNAASANAPKRGGAATLAMGPRIVNVHTLPGCPTQPERPDRITPKPSGLRTVIMTSVLPCSHRCGGKKCGMSESSLSTRCALQSRSESLFRRCRGLRAVYRGPPPLVGYPPLLGYPS
eukprot:42-Chlamydomonas_euryale.AAC.3